MAKATKKEIEEYVYETPQWVLDRRQMIAERDRAVNVGRKYKNRPSPSTCENFQAITNCNDCLWNLHGKCINVLSPFSGTKINKTYHCLRFNRYWTAAELKPIFDAWDKADVLKAARKAAEKQRKEVKPNATKQVPQESASEVCGSE